MLESSDWIRGRLIEVPPKSPLKTVLSLSVERRMPHYPDLGFSHAANRAFKKW
jgi:hypothetical protein